MEQAEISVELRSAGRRHTLRIPDNGRVTVARTPVFSALPEPAALLRDALDHPIGAPPVEQMVKPGSKICILSDDATRPTPVSLVLEELLPRLHGAGIAREDITVVLALGSHRPMTRGEMKKKLGARVCAEYRVLNSEFLDTEQLVQVGVSRMGTPIRVFRPAMEADFRIAIGNIVPHGCMGWSGGAKILYPGITSEDIVSEFHMMQGFQDGIVYGMEACPIRLAVEEWTQKIGLHFIINTVLTGEMKLYRAVAGHYIQAHRVGVGYGREALGVPIRRRPDIVVATSYPTDLDFWQCTKGLYSGGAVIAQGGTMLLLGPCTEGMGPHANFANYLGLPDGVERLQARAAARDTGGELLPLAVGASLGKLRDVCGIHWLTDGLTRQELEPSGFIWHPERELQQTFDAVRRQYRDPSVLVIPVGAETLVYLAPEPV